MTLELAPLAGFTDAPFRLLAHEGGAARAYTEMVSAAALAHGSSPTKQLMEQLPGEGPLVCQLFGASAADLAVAARVADSFGGFVELNLNAGCPMTKVTRCGAGSALADDPARVYELLVAMRENTSLPVSLKTRLGPHPGRTRVFELLDAAERSGASRFILHARYTSQMHGGEVHLGLLGDVVSRSRIPVVGNGSVTDAKSLAAMASTGVSAVMIGRAALANPSIFSRLGGSASTLPPVGSDLAERHLELSLAFRDRLAERYPNDHVPSPDGYASVKMHTHLFRYFSGRPGAAALRARLNSVRTLAEIREIIDAAR